MSTADTRVSVLLVDDRREDLLALSSVLASPQLNLVTASSGGEALRLLLEHEFAAIVLDVMMPDMNGFEVASLLRRRERSSHTPIIFLTGASSDVHYIYRAYSVGGVDYMMKPVDPDVLRAKVRIFVDLFVKDRRIREVERAQRDLELAQLRLASERRYRNLAEAIPQIVWTANEQGRITYANQRWTEHTGVAPEQMQSASWLDWVHPEERQACESRWTEAVAGGREFEVECRLRAGDGTYRWHLCRALPERGADNAVIGWLGTHTDLDDLLRARGQAEATRRRSQFLADASATLSASLAPLDNLARLGHIIVPAIADGCVIEIVEDAGFTACPPSVVHVNPGQESLLVGLRLLPRLRAVASERYADAGVRLFRAMDEKTLAELGRDAEHASGLRALGMVSAMVAPIVARDTLFGAVFLMTSESGRRYDEDDAALAEDLGRRAGTAMENAQLYQKTESAIQARDEFLSIASHELRTPLSALLLQLGALEQTMAGAGRQKGGGETRLESKVAAALRQTRRLTKLVDSLLDVSRLASGHLDLHVEAFDLYAVVRDVADRFAEQAKQAGCELRVLGEPNVIGTWDRLRIEQVITNLVANAVKYGRGQPVDVSVKCDGGVARVAVCDHGIGIAGEDLPRIFHRFERAVSTRQYGGLGLGLYISRQIVQAHGGHIEVASQLGLGSTFTVELPTRETSAERREQQSGRRGG